MVSAAAKRRAERAAILTPQAPKRSRRPRGKDHVKKYIVTRQRGKIAILRPYADEEGYRKRRMPEKPPKGGWPKPPAHWPPGVRVDVKRRVYWLPKGWGQGVKTTCAARLVAYVSPQGKCYYHRWSVEAVVGRKLGPDDNPRSATAWAQEQLEGGKDWRGKAVKWATDRKLFSQLTAEERRHLVGTEALHFAVISARRAGHVAGIRAIVGVEAQLRAAGARPRWYVDSDSLQAYRDLGLDAVAGGRLVPARNKALAHAAQLGRACVQISDDISQWQYYVGDRGSGLVDGNRAAKEAELVRVSPVAAARFLLAKMRGAPPPRPYLGGVFPLGNVGMAFGVQPVAREHFILGDFFVHDLGSRCRFDPAMTLKEDYDFTCAHLSAHGAVLRCNRLFLRVLHETNPGGACSERDAAGRRERENVGVLKRKWPGVFSVNGNRGDDGTQVTMSWRRRRLK